MNGTTDESRMLGLFAELLDYPHSEVAQTARECRALIASQHAEAAALLGEFAAFAERTPPSTLEEIYTCTFELNATCHLYVGYHMFGEAYKRSAFLLELKQRFREHDFVDPGVELEDHLSVLLRFMSMCPDAHLIKEIARDALIPSLEPMVAGPEEEPVEDDQEKPQTFDVGDDYRRALRALQLILQARYGMPEEAQPIPMPDPARLVS